MRRTIEQLRLASLMGWQGDRIMVLSPDEARAWLATSSLEGCLTHLVRYATAYGARSWLTFHAQCGQMVMRGHPSRLPTRCSLAPAASRWPRSTANRRSG